jgi:hypothetical protein
MSFHEIITTEEDMPVLRTSSPDGFLSLVSAEIVAKLAGSAAILETHQLVKS